ncbi:MAG TPA: hypothetical protein PK843_13200 [bacterium]|nr:hypothetical protein [bacterium]HPN35467.1 hypothetical protein [bacterium]
MVEWLKEAPLYWPKIIAVLTFVGVTLWAWRRPKKFIFQDAPDQRLWRDLRIWITLIMSVQIGLYLYF